MEKNVNNIYKVEEPVEQKGKKAKSSDEKTYLTVQIKASLTPIDLNVKPYAGISDIMSDREDKGYSRYSVGRFDNLNDATKKLEELRTKGFKDAFITGRRGNKVLTVKEALMQIKK